MGKSRVEGHQVSRPEWTRRHSLRFSPTRHSLTGLFFKVAFALRTIPWLKEHRHKVKLPKQPTQPSFANRTLWNKSEGKLLRNAALAEVTLTAPSIQEGKATFINGFREAQKVRPSLPHQKSKHTQNLTLRQRSGLGLRALACVRPWVRHAGSLTHKHTRQRSTNFFYKMVDSKHFGLWGTYKIIQKWKSIVEFNTILSVKLICILDFIEFSRDKIFFYGWFSII
jgi:hypothetical protein